MSEGFQPAFDESKGCAAGDGHRVSTVKADELSPTKTHLEVRRLYDFFDVRHPRGGSFAPGDVQNVHRWMLAVTEWIEKQEAERDA